MRTLSVTMSMTLDGVVQGLGRPDEDTRGGFGHGGWGPRYTDDVMLREMGKGMSAPGDMLFGRRTWQDFLGAWAYAEDGNPFTTHLNATRKYVVSTTLTDVDAWQNSVLLAGDAARTVAELKASDGPDLAVVGSACLVRSLQAAGLVDRYALLIHPLVLGEGTRLFDESSPLTEFTLVDSVVTGTGVIIATYHRA
ncbi:MAG TPA: dihydrofolate reductase family protein [Microlunatus sp.]|nr:dihydrofolate reductase family protein [Microlunatus sp.]